MSLFKVFGAAVIGISLAGCGDNSMVSDLRYALNEAMPDPDVDTAVNFMALGALTGSMEFKGAQVSALSGFPYDAPKDMPVITFDAISRNLCHRNVTNDDRKKEVCNEQNSLSETQRSLLQRSICQGALSSGNRVYKQLFCVRPKLT